MAAATHLFGRIGLKLGVSPETKDIRDFVRLSMANLWDEAQGPAHEASCPRIPRRFLHYYWSFRAILNEAKYPLESTIASYTKETVERRIHEKNYEHKSPLHGGNCVAFLASLFWTTNLPCIVFQKTVTVQGGGGTGDLVAVQPFRYALHLKIAYTVETGMHAIQTAQSFGLFDFVFRLSNDNNNTHLSTEQHGHEFHQMLIQLHRTLAPPLALVAVLINFVRYDMTAVHTVSAYPCFQGGHIKFVLCNSHGDECYTDIKRAYDRMNSIGFTLIRQLCVVVQRTYETR